MIHHALYSEDWAACEGRLDSNFLGSSDSKDEARSLRLVEKDVYRPPWAALDHRPSPLIRMKYTKPENQIAHYSLKDVENSMLISRKIVRYRGHSRRLALVKRLLRSYYSTVDDEMVEAMAIVELGLVVLRRVEPMVAAVELVEAAQEQSEQLSEW